MVDPSPTYPRFPDFEPVPGTMAAPELLIATYTAPDCCSYCNDGWRRMVGPQDGSWERIDPEQRQRVRTALLAAFHGEAQSLQVASTYRQPERISIVLNFAPVILPRQGDGPEIHAVTVLGNVPPEHPPTSFRPMGDRMETLGQMAVGIVHDVNNLLSGILGHVELLRPLTVAMGRASEATEHVEVIEQAALDGAALIGKIQQFVRQEKQTQHEPVNLPALVEDCLMLTRPLWDSEALIRGCTIKVESRLQPVPLVAGFPAELREVIVNLIINAVQAMPEGGRLTLETSFDAARGVRLVVSDTGHGMTPEVQAHIFEPLFTTKGAAGTGMGLAVTYGIVREHDGAIDVISEPGNGSRFEIRLPIAGLEVRAPEPAEPVAGEFNASVLVIDDEPMVRTALARLLSLRGHTVHEARSGAEALSILDNTSFDVVITDNLMPELSGLQLAQILRSRYPALPLILISGNGAEGIDVGAVDAVLTKPFKLDVLDTTIRRLLS
jgi:two-component system, cell cycle sensor histidine kinase and response regulator CckA